jgi:hypothetical protein
MADQGPDQSARPGYRPSLVWRRPRELGSVQSITAVGGTPISVLAGFSLTSAIMVAAAGGGVWRDVAVALFAVAAGAFILALELIVEAVNYAATPDMRLTYHPEAAVDEDALAFERDQQRQDEWLLDIYNRRISLGTTAGIAASLLGLGAALLTARVSWGVLAGVAVVVPLAALAVLNQGRRAAWLFPNPASVPANRRQARPLDDLARSSMPATAVRDERDGDEDGD